MKVFISWSGNSKDAAHAIFKALPTLFDQAEPWISVENRSGTMWLPEIDKQLSSTDFGIVCVTRENQHAPWLNFEAGALSRRVDAKRELMPVLLLGVDSMNDVDGPITGFQMKLGDLEGFMDVMKDLNNSDLGPKINESILRSRVESAWPSIEAEVRKIRMGHAVEESDERTDSEKIDELLDVARSMARSLAPTGTAVGTNKSRISSESMRAIAKAMGGQTHKFELGEVTISYPDEKRVVVKTQNPVTAEADEAFKKCVFDELSREVEVSYQSMTPSEAEKNRWDREHIARLDSAPMAQ